MGFNSAFKGLINVFLIVQFVGILCHYLEVLSKLFKAEDVFVRAVILKEALVEL